VGKKTAQEIVEHFARQRGLAQIAAEPGAVLIESEQVN